MSDRFTIGERDVLLVVDVQNDFCPGGGLGVPDGDEVVPVVNRLAKKFAHVVLTQDWHPRGHLSFASSNPGTQAFQTIEVAYGAQVMWPDHCIQGTPGAEFRADLDIPHAELVLRKGYHRAIDSYSAFYENDRATHTGLAGYLRERGFERVVHGRPRLRFLRALFGGRRPSRRLQGGGGRGRLPQHRPRGLGGRDARTIQDARYRLRSVRRRRLELFGSAPIKTPFIPVPAGAGTNG